MDTTTLLSKARYCLQLEIKAIQATATDLDESFVDVIRDIEATVTHQKKIIFSGVGKNAAICQKLVGTFNSTGVPACLLHPSQALHGDIGVLTEKDLVFLISNSGETEELLHLLPIIKRQGGRIVAITAAPGSQLAIEADRVLIYRVPEEACPLNLAPTASTAAALALGDALAMVYLEIRGFTREDFAKLHPAGSLGKTLLLRVKNIMRSGVKFATAPETVTVQEALILITKAKCGAIALVSPQDGCLSGIFTDGEFRRCTLKGNNFIQEPVAKFMNRNPLTIQEESLAIEALKVFEKSKVDDLIVINDKNHPVGLIDAQDLPKLKLI